MEYTELKGYLWTKTPLFTMSTNSSNIRCSQCNKFASWPKVQDSARQMTKGSSNPRTEFETYATCPHCKKNLFK